MAAVIGVLMLATAVVLQGAAGVASGAGRCTPFGGGSGVGIVGAVMGVAAADAPSCGARHRCVGRVACGGIGGLSSPCGCLGRASGRIADGVPLVDAGRGVTSNSSDRRGGTSVEGAEAEDCWTQAVPTSTAAGGSSSSRPSSCSF